MQPQMQAEAQPQVVLTSSEQPVLWRLSTRIAFRFICAYVFIYGFPFPLDAIPYAGNYLSGKYTALWQKAVPWVGAHVLHLSYPITIFTNGSGDTTYDYVLNSCFLVLAMAAATVWSLLDRKRPNYRKLHQWFIIYMRFLVGAAMVSYGMNKVFKLQFPAPFLSRLTGSYGESTPMGLLWTFMGASKTYTIFAGAIETLGGVLLIVPRLTTLGALVSMAAMGNVFMLNMSYDVPVKLFSFHLLVFSALLVLPDLRRLANVLVFNRTTDPAVSPPLFQRKWLNYGLLAVQLLFGLYLFGSYTYSNYRAAKLRGDNAPKPPLHGIWMVDEFVLNGQLRPPVPTDDLRWQKLIIDSRSEAFIQSMAGSHQRFWQQLNAEKKTLTLGRRAVLAPRAQLTFENTAPDVLTLQGQFDGQPLRARLHHIPDPKFMLTTRGFHWINEYPFNRFDE
jgi:uncharacterized membrane protein YphA (DoxX/SURF4 family)